MTGTRQGSDDDDYELVCRAQHGDTHAFDQLMLRHQVAVSSYLRRYTSSMVELEDLTQSVFVKAYLNLATYRPVAPFYHWLRAIASRVGYDYWRRRKRGRDLVLFSNMDDCVEAKTEEPDRFAEFDKLSRVIDSLSAEDRQVLYLLHVDGIGVAEIAKTMGWNLSMTKMRAFRARKRLKKIFEAEE